MRLQLSSRTGEIDMSNFLLNVIEAVIVFSPIVGAFYALVGFSHL